LVRDARRLARLQQEFGAVAGVDEVLARPWNAGLHHAGVALRVKYPENEGDGGTGHKGGFRNNIGSGSNGTNRCYPRAVASGSRIGAEQIGADKKPVRIKTRLGEIRKAVTPAARS